MTTTDPSRDKARLPGYRIFMRGVATATGFIYGLILIFTKDALPSMRYPTLVIGAFLIASVLTVCMTTIEKRYRWKNALYVSNIAWMLAYIAIVYGTGGAASLFLFVLLIPLLTSAWDLDPIVTRRVGIVMFAAAALIIFADPVYLQSKGFVVEYILRVSGFGILMYYIYRLLKETLLQKYEKEEMNRKYDQLVELDRMKSDFINVVSHRLRTPLTGARWGMEVALEEKDISDATKALLKQTAERVENATDIVNQMIRSLHSDSSLARDTHEKIALVPLLQDIVTKLQYFIIGNRATLSFGRLTPCLVIGSRDALAAALSNIIDNAVRYSPGGKITIDIGCDETHATITVSDTGIGIEKGDQEYIFQRFFRSKEAMLVDPNASGLGLYISKQIIQQHDGTITFTSELGKGTQVTITLPRHTEAQQ